MTEPLNLAKICNEWLQQCGSCDAGLPMSCTCPQGDYRPVMLRLVDEVDRLRSERNAAYLRRADVLLQLGHIRPQVKVYDSLPDVCVQARRLLIARRRTRVLP